MRSGIRTAVFAAVTVSLLLVAASVAVALPDPVRPGDRFGHLTEQSSISPVLDQTFSKAFIVPGDEVTLSMTVSTTDQIGPEPCSPSTQEFDQVIFSWDLWQVFEGENVLSLFFASQVGRQHDLPLTNLTFHTRTDIFADCHLTTVITYEMRFPSSSTERLPCGMFQTLFHNPADYFSEQGALGDFATLTVVATGCPNPGTVIDGARTIGFWRSKNGRALISNGCLGADRAAGTTDDLVPFLRRLNEFMDLQSTSTCSGVANYVVGTINAATRDKINDPSNLNAMLKAQILGTALNIYFSDPLMGGNRLGAPAPIGQSLVDLQHLCNLKDLPSGEAVCSGIRDVSAAFNGESSMSVAALVEWASAQASPASSTNRLASPWYGQDKTLQDLSKDAFDSINNNVGFAP
jgi:hypothetical protein